MKGTITTTTVILLAPTIVHEFGLKAWLHCMFLIATGRAHTFLEAIVRLHS